MRRVEQRVAIVRADKIVKHPLNFRTHDESQRDALRSILKQVGNVGRPVVYPIGDGRYRLIDGHLRSSVLNGRDRVEVLVVAFNSREARKALATHDPLSEMTDHDSGALKSLLEGIHIESEELARFIAEDLPMLSSGSGGGGQSERLSDDEDRGERDTPPVGFVRFCCPKCGHKWKQPVVE